MTAAKGVLDLPGGVVGGIKSGAEGIESAIGFVEEHGITSGMLDKGKDILDKVIAGMAGAEKNLKGFEEVAGPVGKFRRRWPPRGWISSRPESRRERRPTRRIRKTRSSS